MAREAIQTKMQLDGEKIILPEVLKQSLFNSEVLRIARLNFSLGEEFEFWILRKLLEELGIYPANEQRGHCLASSYLTHHGFVRLGEGGKSLTPTRQWSRDTIWKRIR